MDEEVERPRMAADRMAAGAYAALIWAPALFLAAGVIGFWASFSMDPNTGYLIAGLLGLAGLITGVAGIINAVEGVREVAALAERAALVTLRDLPPAH